LAAIETRAKFDAGQAALPWLLGLLAVEARHLRRERARPAPLMQPAQASDPGASAAAAELQAAVQEVRRQLAVPYRDVLQLHLEQGLNSREIAERLGRPAGTVRTQLVRALELLRRRLPSGFVAGLAPVVPDLAALAGVKTAVLTVAKSALPTAAAAGGAASATLVTGGMLMSKKVLLTVPATVLLLGVACYLSWAAGVREPSRPVPTTIAAAARSSGEPLHAIANETSTPAQRDEVSGRAALPMPADPTGGMLVVWVRWSGRDQPAAGLGVFARHGPQNAPTLDRHTRTTDDDGRCVFDRLQPGTWSVQPLVGAVVSAEVIAGAARELRIEASDRCQLHGRVVDAAEQPIAAATIWMSGAHIHNDFCPAGTSGADGRFTVPFAQRALVGARKPGFAPSPMWLVDPGADGALPECVLHLAAAGGAIAGTVQDQHGKPIARARLRIGNEHSFWKPGFGSLAAQEGEPRGVDLLTGDEGRFELTGLALGDNDVRAWAEGFAPGLLRVAIAVGTTAHAIVVLEPGATVTGIVRDTDGVPVVDATVECGGSNFSYALARSDRLGHYRLDNLAKGTTELLAHGGQDQRDCVQLELQTGTVHEWNPALGSGRIIAGQLLDPEGKPYPHARLICQAAGHDTSQAPVDSDGRFRFSGLWPEPHALRITQLDGGMLREVSNVQPGTLDLVIRLTREELPTARLRVRLLDAGGRPVTGDLSGWRVGASLGAASKPGSGVFELGPFAAGTYEFTFAPATAQQPRWAFPLPTVTLAPDESRDLGDVTVPEPGRIMVHAIERGGAAAKLPWLTLCAPDGRTMGLPDADSAPVPPGRWLLQVKTDGGEGRTNVDITAGTTTDVTVPILSDSGIDFAVAPADDQPLFGPVQLQVRDATGQLAAAARAFAQHAPATGRMFIAPGNYAMTALGPGGLRGEANVELHAGETVAVRLVVRPVR
ncbi:MAG TPA: sigma factor-like helix-turn-helix DNA-binding protein, partial [Planctomycetota bacterium]|nr:sigma factor-like helix-turn-helix DNA-binding protein [Planctomycetota bacterium]